MIADAHSDLLIELVHRGGEENPFRTHWLRKLNQGGVTCQVCAVYVDRDYVPESALRCALRQIEAFNRAARENASDVVAVGDVVALDEALSAEKTALLLSMEGVEPLGIDVALVDLFIELGVRMIGLTWNRSNAFATGAEDTTGSGLTKLGEELVSRLVDRPVVLDLAHASSRTFADVLERFPPGRVIVSHGACRALCETPRNLSDLQLEALAEHRGFLGLMAHPFVIDPARPTIARLVDHVDHAVRIMGMGHVGVGGDFIRQVHRSVSVSSESALFPDGVAMDDVIPGLEGPEDYGSLITVLLERGYAEDDLAAVLHGNLLRVLRRSLTS